MTKTRFAVAAVALAGSALVVAAITSPAPNDTDAVITDLIHVAQLNPADASTRLRLGVMLTQQSRFTDAQRWFDEAYKLDPNLANDIMVGASFKQQGQVIAPIKPASTSPGARTTYPNAGPDILVGDLSATGPFRWGRVGNITAYSIGTTSCNGGDTNAMWVASTPDHPVIHQAMYRLKPDPAGYDTFEQIGHSWLKHGFLALTQNLCSSQFGYNCNGMGGAVLGVGCSDPYSASLNGSYTHLGPKFEVKADTGEFPFPYGSFPDNSPIGKRLQVKDNDLLPAMNVGARYFGEGHYIARDDAMAGNGDNNASYREFTVAASPPNIFDLTWSASTQREKSAIQAWADIDPAVTISSVSDPDGGYWRVACKATNLGGGMWHYEYAVYNMNSDRSGQAFTVPLGANTNVTNVGFHDINWHSGSPYSTIDWPSVISPGSSITWQTETFVTNPNANALRWATLYNFRFDADTPPTSVTADVTLFKPGVGSSVQMTVQAPAAATPPCPWDFDGDGMVGATDLAQLVGQWGLPFGAFELSAMIGSWGPCP